MALEQKKPSLVRQGICQFVAGGCAGFVEVSLMHPLDLVKTRFQVQGSNAMNVRYTSVLDCFRQMVRAEGFGSLYKGILPPLLAETPKRAVKFFTFEQYKILFSFGKKQPDALAFTLAGLGCGLTEAFVINPFEVVKVRLQTETGVRLKEQRSTFSTARDIVKADGLGLKGLNKGLTSTLGRHGVFNMIYFSFYHNVKDAFPVLEDPVKEFGRKFLIGLTAGTLSSIANIPFDVAKSRIQGPQPIPGQIKYKTCFSTMAIVRREEGFKALYRGLVPKIMRLGPGGAIMLLVYDYAFQYLKKEFL